MVVSTEAPVLPYGTSRPKLDLPEYGHNSSNNELAELGRKSKTLQLSRQLVWLLYKLKSGAVLFA